MWNIFFMLTWFKFKNTHPRKTLPWHKRGHHNVFSLSPCLSSLWKHKSTRLWLNLVMSNDKVVGDNYWQWFVDSTIKWIYEFGWNNSCLNVWINGRWMHFFHSFIHERKIVQLIRVAFELSTCLHFFFFF